MLLVLKVCEIIDVGEDAKPPKKKLRKIMNHHQNAKIFAMRSLLGLKCCNVIIMKFNISSALFVVLFKLFKGRT
jgi:hypothetical protein